MHSGLFITGTDTGVGKTHFSAMLVRALRARGVDAVGVKPFCCGDRSDAELLQEASDSVVSIAEVNPVWLRVPAAPYAASLIENRLLDIATAADTIERLAQKHAFLVVEGVGGWRVPLTQHLCMSEFARGLNFPVIAVSANRLGTINHTQLTVDSILATKMPFLGVVLNHPDAGMESPATVTNKAVLQDLLTVPLLGELDHGALTLPQGVIECVVKGLGEARA